MVVTRKGTDTSSASTLRGNSSGSLSKNDSRGRLVSSSTHRNRGRAGAGTAESKRWYDQRAPTKYFGAATSRTSTAGRTKSLKHETGAAREAIPSTSSARKRQPLALTESRSTLSGSEAHQTAPLVSTVTVDSPVSSHSVSNHPPSRAAIGSGASRLMADMTMASSSRMRSPSVAASSASAGSMYDLEWVDTQVVDSQPQPERDPTAAPPFSPAASATSYHSRSSRAGSVLDPASNRYERAQRSASVAGSASSRTFEDRLARAAAGRGRMMPLQGNSAGYDAPAPSQSGLSQTRGWVHPQSRAPPGTAVRRSAAPGPAASSAPAQPISAAVHSVAHQVHPVTPRSPYTGSAYAAYPAMEERWPDPREEAMRDRRLAREAELEAALHSDTLRRRAR